MFKNYKLILKLLIKDMLRRRDKGQFAVIISMGIIYAIIISFFMVLIVYFRDAISQMEGIAGILTTILFADFMLTVVLGIFAAVSYLFLSQDSEFFLGLPVKQSTVFLAKLTTVYLTELIVSIGIILPTFIVLGIIFNLGPLFYLMIPVAILAVPVFALMFIVLISMPIVWLVSKFRNRGAVTTIIVLTLFTGIFAGYYLLIPMVADGTLFDYTMLGGNIVTNIMMYPLYMLMNFATLTPIFGLSLPVSMIVALGTFIIATVVLFAISYFLALLAYQKLSARFLENKSRVGGRKRQYATGTAKVALLKKEWRMIIRNSMVALSTLVMIVVGPLGVAFTVLGMGSGGNSAELAAMIWSFGILIFLMLLGVSGASHCISREGANFYYMKMLPLSPALQIKMKQIFYMLLSTAYIITSLITLSVVMIVSSLFIWWAPLLAAAVAFAWSFALINLSIYLDLKGPKLDWRNVREVTKRLKNSAVLLLWMLISSVVGGIIVFVVLMFTDSYAPPMSPELFLALSLSGFALLGVIASVLSQVLLKKNIDNFFKRIIV